MKASTKAYRRFNVTFLAFVLPGLTTIGLFNALVDPYGVVNSPQLSRVNELKPEQYHHARLFKAVGVMHNKPKNLLLGSSRSDLGLDPDHRALADGTTYNLALVGPNMYEVRRYFEHALANQPEVKTVVLGIDFFMFNENWKNSPDFDENRLGQEKLNIQDAINISFSTDALKSSKRTIKSSLDSDAYYLYRANGLRYVYGNEPDEPLANKFEKMISGFLEGERSYTNFKFSPSFLDDFKQVVETCRQRNIELKIFISPLHASHLEAIKTAGMWSELENWKRQVVEITPVWDFSGYNSITTEPINENMKNYWDSSHYRKEVGDLILNRLFQIQEESVPKDFGNFLTAENIEQQLAKKQAEREIWENNNPNLVQLVQDLKRKADRNT